MAPRPSKFSLPNISTPDLQNEIKNSTLPQLIHLLAKLNHDLQNRTSYTANRQISYYTGVTLDTKVSKNFHLNFNAIIRRFRVLEADFIRSLVEKQVNEFIGGIGDILTTQLSPATLDQIYLPNAEIFLGLYDINIAESRKSIGRKAISKKENLRKRMEDCNQRGNISPLGKTKSQLYQFKYHTNLKIKEIQAALSLWEAWEEVSILLNNGRVLMKGIDEWKSIMSKIISATIVKITGSESSTEDAKRDAVMLDSIHEYLQTAHLNWEDFCKPENRLSDPSCFMTPHPSPNANLHPGFLESMSVFPFPFPTLPLQIGTQFLHPFGNPNQPMQPLNCLPFPHFPFVPIHPPTLSATSETSEMDSFGMDSYSGSESFDETGINTSVGSQKIDFENKENKAMNKNKTKG